MPGNYRDQSGGREEINRLLPPTPLAATPLAAAVNLKASATTTVDGTRSPPPGQAYTPRRGFETLMAAMFANLQAELAAEHIRLLQERDAGGLLSQPSKGSASDGVGSSQRALSNRIGKTSQDAEIQTRVDWNLPQRPAPRENRMEPKEQEIIDVRVPRLLAKSVDADTEELLKNVHIDVQQSAALEHSPSKLQVLLQALTVDLCIRLFMNVVIVSNVLVLGAQASSEWSGWLYVDLVYCILFVLEILYKVSARGGLWIFVPCRHDDWRWNVFDLLLAGLATMEVVLGFADNMAENAASDVSSIRVVRLVRIARVLRVARLGIFRDLIMMIEGALGGVRTLFWSFALIIVPLYAFALFLTETLGSKKVPKGQAGWEFGNMQRSMFTAFRCLVAGDCASMNGTPLFAHVIEEQGWFFGFFYCCCSVMMTFGLFNVIVSIYVENVIANAKHNDDLQRKRRLHDKTRLAEKTFELIYYFFHELYKQRLGESFTEKCPEFNFQEAMQMEILQAEFEKMAKDQRAQLIFHALELPPEDCESLFEIFDADGGGSLTLEEILRGIKKLRGDPRRSDVIAVALMMRATQEQLRTLGADVLALRRFHCIGT
jgi:hypothetical protein